MTGDKVSDSVQQVTSHLWADLFSRELIIFCAYICKEPSIWQCLKPSTLQLKCNYHLSPLPVTQYFLESLSICAHFHALAYTQQSFFPPTSRVRSAPSHVSVAQEPTPSSSNHQLSLLCSLHILHKHGPFLTMLLSNWFKLTWHWKHHKTQQFLSEKIWVYNQATSSSWSLLKLNQ